MGGGAKHAHGRANVTKQHSEKTCRAGAGLKQAQPRQYLSELKRTLGAALLLAVFLVLPVGAWIDKDVQPIDDPAADLTQAGVWKRDDESLVFEIRTRGLVMPEHLRILLLDHETANEDPRNEAVWMIERERLYQRAIGVPGWSWNEIAPVISVAASNIWIVHVPAGVMPARGAWLVESVGDDGQTVDRAPNAGIFRFVAAETPIWSVPSRRISVDLRSLYEQAPVALSLRYETELKAIRWEKLPETPPPMAWMTGTTCAVPIRVQLRDVASGEAAECMFTSAWSGAEWKRWDGEALGLYCSARMTTNNKFGSQFDLFLRSDDERRIDAQVTLALEGQGWVWHGERSPVALHENSKPRDAPTNGANSNLAAFFPFGVVARGQQIAWLACHPDEPRSVRMSAECNESETRLIANCPLALTGATSNFPQRASLSLVFGSFQSSASNIFLAGMAAMHEQGFFGGARRFDLRGNLSEWPKLAGYYELPMSSGLLRSAADAELVLDLSAGLPDPAGLAAMITQLGGVRQQDVAFVVRRSVSPRAGSAIDWWLDPDLRVTRAQPMSPAMYLWRDIESVLADRRAEGVVLRLPDLTSRHYDKAALGVADHPCDYDFETGQYFLTGRVGVFEFLQLAYPKMRGANKALALEVVGSLDVFPLCFGDAIVVASLPTGSEEDTVEWLDRLRVIAGARPIFAEPEFFKVWSGDAQVRYALRWGLWPVGAPTESVAVFRPLLERVARRGWNPGASAIWSLSNADVRVFGSAAEPHERVFSRRDRAAVVSEYTLNAEPGWLFVNPLNGDVRPGTWPWRTRLSPNETMVWNTLPEACVSEEKEFLAEWSKTWPFAGYTLRNLESWEREKALGCVAAVDWPHPVGQSGRQRVVLNLKNTGPQRVKFGGIRLVGRLVWATAVEGVLDSGSETNVVCEFDGQGVPTNGWMELQWQIEKETQTALMCSRWWRATIAEAIEVTRERSELWLREDDRLVAQLEIHNHTDEEQKLTVRWQGDFKDGRRAVTLQPRESRRVEIELERGKATSGELFVRVEQDRQLVTRLHYEWALFPKIGNRRE